MAGPDATVGEPAPHYSLTPRETEVLMRTSAGRTNAQVASEIGTTVHAVKFHLASIFRKLGVSNRTEAAVTYHRSIAPNDLPAAGER